MTFAEMIDHPQPFQGKPARRNSSFHPRHNKHVKRVIGWTDDHCSRLVRQNLRSKLERENEALAF